jgi:lyso-ornithine lipid O-acyltransferase
MASFIDDVTLPKGTFRLCVTAVLIGCVALVLFPFQYVSWKLNLPSRRWLPRLFHRAVARIINLRVHVIGQASTDRPMLILSNHVSWLDILAIGTVMPVSFIAKSEVEAWPLFGLLAKLQRSIFVDRNRRGETGKANAAIAIRLEEGDPIVLFAESTTSDGNRILPFRSALVGAARDSILSDSTTRHVCLQPLALAYHGADGLPTGRMGRARIGWYGDMEMLPHLVGILRGGPLDVTLNFGEPIAFDHGTDRKLVTKLAEDQVRRMLGEALTGRKVVSKIEAGLQVPEKLDATYAGKQ